MKRSQTHSRVMNKSLAPKVAVIAALLGIIMACIPPVRFLAYVFGGVALLIGVAMLLASNRRANKKVRVRNIVIIILALVAIGLGIVLSVTVDNDTTNHDNGTALTADDVKERAAGKRTDELLQSDIIVDVGVLTVSDGKASLPLQVTNMNTQRKTYTIKISALDKTGKSIADDQVVVERAPYDEMIEKNVFTSVSGNQATALKSATFKITSIAQE